MLSDRAETIARDALHADVDLLLSSYRTGVPLWTQGRLFKRNLKDTPAAYYRGLRLSEARNLLRNSSLRVSEISSLCGFENPESFA